VNERIREIRLAKGQTQTEFAYALGVKRNTIATYEAGTRVPSNALITSICRTFSINETWLRTGEGEMHADTADTIFEQFAVENALGPAGKMIVQAALKVYHALGEQAFIEMVQEVLPMMHEMAQQAEAHKFSAGAAQDTEQVQSVAE
jgi:transcriptional regulator with XRE-family HTH domain